MVNCSYCACTIHGKPGQINCHFSFLVELNTPLNTTLLLLSRDQAGPASFSCFHWNHFFKHFNLHSCRSITKFCSFYKLSDLPFCQGERNDRLQVILLICLKIHCHISAVIWAHLGLQKLWHFKFEMCIFLLVWVSVFEIYSILKYSIIPNIFDVIVTSITFN